MDSKRIVVVGGRVPYDTRAMQEIMKEGYGVVVIGDRIPDYEYVPEPTERELTINPKCKNDHGERANRKLRDQPFYLRERNGKMRRY